MQCTYVGNFNELHKATKKRRMIGPVIEKALSSIVEQGISCETYREKEAVRLMKTGKYRKFKYNCLVIKKNYINYEV